VVQADPPYPTRTALAALVRWFAGTELDAQLLEDRSRIERRTRVHASLGRAALKAGLPRESGRRHWQQVAERFFAEHDVLVTPALAQRPLAAVPWGQRGWLANVTANSRYAPFAAPWNLAGWPAAALPAGTHPAGTPLSVQLVARPGSEQLLLQVAAQLEQLRPWPRLAPL
jgi:amidase